jgi:hypothetical protein
MPANTPKGYPYPLGTDRVMDGDDSIHSLATAVDSRLGVACAGTGVINVTTGGTAAVLAVTFPAGLFTAVPVVFMNITNLQASTSNAAAAQTITPTGFNATGVRPGAGAVNFCWHATQLP